MKPKLIVLFALVPLSFTQCKKTDSPAVSPKYAADVAHAWMQMQIKLTKSTAGYNSIVSDRSFGYACITMYESVFPAITGATSILSQIGGSPVSLNKNIDQYYWPESLNAAMATITRQFFESTSAENLQSIDSLEAAYKSQFQTLATTDKITNAENYGRQVADSIFNWTKTDGGHQAYMHLNDPAYIPPTGQGLWVPTSAALALLPHWGDNRTFIANDASGTQPGAPMAYSADPQSPFYSMVNELYTISLSLTHEDSTIAKFWADFPGNLNVPAHATNILSQLLVLNKSDLYAAAGAYALHGIAMSDGAVSVMKTKYTCNLIRPVTYIRNVMGISTWNTLIPTPPHSEYSAAHAVISAASATVMEKLFCANYKFSDHSYESSYGIRSFNSFQEYAKEAGRSSLLGGIHYSPSIAARLQQGTQIGNLVIKLKITINTL